MKPIFLAFLLACAVFPACADTGCVEKTTTMIKETTCTRFECVQNSSDGECIAWNCITAQVLSYTDKAASGCVRQAVCDAGYFRPGAPDQPETEISELCDWYPCIQADPTTKVCLLYRCISRRTFTITRVNYPRAVCALDRKPAQSAAKRKARKAQAKSGKAVQK